MNSRQRFVDFFITSVTIALNESRNLDLVHTFGFLQSSVFWVLCRSLKDFVASEGCLPVRGSLPDMAADSDSYIRLQRVYRERAARDADVVARRARQLLKDLGRSSPETTLTDQEVARFCRNAAFLRLQRGTCVADEYSKFPKLPGLGE